MSESAAFLPRGIIAQVVHPIARTIQSETAIFTQLLLPLMAIDHSPAQR